MFSKPKATTDAPKNDAKASSNPQEIDIKGLDKATLLAGLYNRSKPLGSGFLPPVTKQMTYEEAKKIIDAGQLKFNYLIGRAMKINLEGDTLNSLGYDRDIGNGAALEVVALIKKGLAVQPKPANPSKSS